MGECLNFQGPKTILNLIQVFHFISWFFHTARFRSKLQTPSPRRLQWMPMGWDRGRRWIGTEPIINTVTKTINIHCNLLEVGAAIGQCDTAITRIIVSDSRFFKHVKLLVDASNYRIKKVVCTTCSCSLGIINFPESSSSKASLALLLCSRSGWYEQTSG